MKRFVAAITLLSGMFVPALALAASSQTMCYDLYKPVCAAEQVQCFAAPCYPVYHTYSNECFAAADDATVIHEGECTDAETGPVKPAEPYQPPAGCIAWNDGCNSCARQENGQAACTLMACIGPMHPGYCTHYETSAPHETTNPGAATSSPAATSAGATSTPSEHAGFFARFWHAFLSFFGR